MMLNESPTHYFLNLSLLFSETQPGAPSNPFLPYLKSEKVY